MDDYRNWKPVVDPEHIDHVTQDRITTGLELLMRKGVYPYEWMNDEEKLYTTTSLPSKNVFTANYIMKIFPTKITTMPEKYGIILSAEHLKIITIYI